MIFLLSILLDILLENKTKKYLKKYMYLRSKMTHTNKTYFRKMDKNVRNKIIFLTPLADILGIKLFNFDTLFRKKYLISYIFLLLK